MVQPPSTEIRSTPVATVLKSGVDLILATFAQYEEEELLRQRRDLTTVPTKPEMGHRGSESEEEEVASISDDDDDGGR